MTSLCVSAGRWFQRGPFRIVERSTVLAVRELNRETASVSKRLDSAAGRPEKERNTLYRWTRSECQLEGRLLSGPGSVFASALLTLGAPFGPRSPARSFLISSASPLALSRDSHLGRLSRSCATGTPLHARWIESSRCTQRQHVRRCIAHAAGGSPDYR